MKRRAQNDVFLVGQLAAAISIASFFYYLRHGELLLYGDAVAHINIARRVFDSLTPGPLQLGTVWLPLPHLLMIPFILSRSLWQTGIGGSVPSLVAFVLSSIGIFRLVSLILSRSPEDGSARFAAFFATAMFALNPNLMYLQSTAMTEAVYLAFFIWAVVFFTAAVIQHEPAPASGSRLTRCGLCLFGACLTRYDGWFLSVVISAFLFSALASGQRARLKWRSFILLAAAAPVFWLAYNAAVYRNPLEFADGPYSAKAIEQRTANAQAPPHPGAGDLRVAFRYFFKSAELNLAPGFLQYFWVIGLLLGTAVVVLFQRGLWPLLVLWTPVPFYMISIARGGVPIFVPSWWPFSYYNLRYGVEMLPAFAVFTAIATRALMRFFAGRTSRAIVAAAFLALASASYVVALRRGPVSIEEAAVNSRTRVALENEIASVLLKLPLESRFLMYLGDHVGAFQLAGIPLAHVINEGNHRPWMRPDPDGLWERALNDPAKYVDYVIAFASDPVATQVNQRQLSSIAIVRVTGQPQATIYRTAKSTRPQ